MPMLSPVLFIAMSFSIVDVMSTSNIVMAFSSSATTPSFSKARQNYLSPHSSNRNPSRICMGAFCAEAVASKIHDVLDGGNAVNDERACDVHISRLENEKEKLGYDVTSAREWMEHIEQCDGPLYGIGAYTVLRCDATFSKNGCQWKIWGLDFHMDRLCLSYEMLMETFDPTCDVGKAPRHDGNSRYLDEPKLQTNDVIAGLLDEAKQSLLKDGPAEDSHADDLGDEELTRTLMLTILWSPPKMSADQKDSKLGQPVIRGHAAFAGAARVRSDKEDSISSSISACLAIPSDPTHEALSMLPRRHANDDDSGQSKLVGASAKISSWCRVRRPLEDPVRFKVPGSGVGEVLLVNKIKGRLNDGEKDFIDSLEILEGLTSNLFVVYKDGTVRTAPVGKVLSGYARHLVVEGLHELQSTGLSSPIQDLVLDGTNAPTIQDAKNGLWSEVFVTSAIRLIIPVDRVIIASVGGMDSTILWQSNSNEHNTYPVTKSIWSAVHRQGSKLVTSIDTKST